MDDHRHLEVDHMERKMAELSSIVVSPSAYMVKWMRDMKWNLPHHTYVHQNILPKPLFEVIRFSSTTTSTPFLLFAGKNWRKQQTRPHWNERSSIFWQTRETKRTIYLLERTCTDCLQLHLPSPSFPHPLQHHQFEHHGSKQQHNYSTIHLHKAKYHECVDGHQGIPIIICQFYFCFVNLKIK